VSRVSPRCRITGLIWGVLDCQRHNLIEGIEYLLAARDGYIVILIVLIPRHLRFTRPSLSASSF